MFPEKVVLLSWLVVERIDFVSNTNLFAVVLQTATRWRGTDTFPLPVQTGF